MQWFDTSSAQVLRSTNPQELARRFNEDEAVWRCYQQKRKLRRAIQRKLGTRSSLPEKALDQIDWCEAERECRTIRAIGIPLPSTPKRPK